jgi:3-phenylpropionate/trans-cinnamate dioxygenase ferredoxin component
MSMPEYLKVATTDEMPSGGRKSLVIDDRAVLLVRSGDAYYAIEDICSHDGQPLTEGALFGTAIECPRHGARFDLCSGRPLCMPAVEPIATFEVKLSGKDILVRTKA